MTTHKKTELTDRKFEKLPDDRYIAVLDNVKLDLANKYGARVNMTFKLPNRRLIWVDVKENTKSQKGPLAGAWYTLTLMGVNSEVRDSLTDEFTTDDFLKSAFTKLEALVGNYFELELKTTTSKTTNKEYQNANVLGSATESDFQSFQMPKTEKLFDDSDDFATPF